MQKNWVIKNKTPVIMAVLALFLSGAVLWDAFGGKEKPCEKTGFAMGSVLSVTMYGGSEDTAADIFSSVASLENRISRNVAGSFLSQINRDSGAQTDEAFAGMMQELIALCRETGGAFDITLGAVSDLWGFGSGEEKIPSESQLASCLAHTGYDKIKIQGTEISIPAGMQLDAGAVGKGMACDAAKSVLEQDSSVAGAVVASGGSVLLYGINPGGLWQVGIRDPEGGQNDIIAVLSLSGDVFVSTSGNYEKYFMQNGVRYCHILAPETGMPAQSGLSSVTVAARTGAQSDALSTACFVLGYEKSLPLLEQFGAEAVFITDAGDILPTDGIKDALRIE